MSTPPIRMLLVDDDEDDYILTRDLVRDIPGGMQLEWVSNVAAARARLTQGGIDVLLLDYQLGVSTGLDFLRELRSKGEELPIIMLTGLGDREIDIASMAAGATDYLVKSELSTQLLDRAIRYASSVSRLHRRLLDEHERLQHMEKLSAVGLVAAGIVHEVTNPLAGVMSLVRALQENKVAPESRDEYFRTINDGLERMRVTLRGLLDLAREQPLTIATVDLAEVAGAGLRLMAATLRGKGISAVQEIPPETWVRADRTHLMQAILNLLMNAVDATPQGGRISLRTSARDGAVGVVVEDSGTGIPAALHERIMEPFFSTKAPGKGTGLGLPFVVQTAKSHGGELGIDSAPGTGTRMTLWLPVNRRS